MRLRRDYPALLTMHKTRRAGKRAPYYLGFEELQLYGDCRRESVFLATGPQLHLFSIMASCTTRTSSRFAARATAYTSTASPREIERQKPRTKQSPRRLPLRSNWYIFKWPRLVQCEAAAEAGWTRFAAMRA